MFENLFAGSTRGIWGICVTAALIVSCVTPAQAAPATDLVSGAPVKLEDRVRGIIVAYEPGVPQLNSLGAPIGSDVVDAAVGSAKVTRSTALGAGMSELMLSTAIDLATAQKLAAQLTADPRIKWASPDGFKKTGRDSAEPSIAGGASPAAVTPLSVTVNSAYGSATKSAAFSYVDAPSASSLSPSAGSVSGGTSVTISGTNFLDVTSVTVGGTLATLGAKTATSVVVTTPAKAAGTYDVVVNNAAGSTTLSSAFTFVALPTVTSVTPAVGALVGGQTVTIGGTNLATTSSVTFGGVAGTNLSATSTSLTVTTPAKSAGTVSVVVTTTGGSVTKTSAFSYVAPPTVSSLSATVGSIAGGKSVTITGTNLANISAVSFGDTSATISSKTATSLVVLAPAHSLGSVSLTVSGLNGSATKSGAFTYVEGPTISSLSVLSGPLTGGTSTVISGTNLSGATAVTFGGTAGTVVSSTAETVTVRTPAKAAGTVNVVVTTPGGSVTKAAGFTFVAAPTITTVTPASGSTAGGQTVTLGGTNLATTTAVTFGGTVGSVVSSTATTVTVTTPAKAAGAVSVVVTTAGGSVTKRSAFTFRVVAPTAAATATATVTAAATPPVTPTVAQSTSATQATSSASRRTTKAIMSALSTPTSPSTDVGPLVDCGYTDTPYLIQRCYDDDDFDAGDFAYDSEISFSDLRVTAAKKTMMIVNVVPYDSISDNNWLTTSGNEAKVMFDTNGDETPEIAITDQNQVLASGRTGNGWVYDWSAGTQSWVKRASTCSTTISRIASGIIIPDITEWWQFQTDWTCLFGTESNARTVRAMTFLKDADGQDWAPNTFADSDTIDLAATSGAGPTISAVTPSTGPNAGGTSVTITGTNLSTAALVTIGGATAAITAQNSTSVTATTARTNVVGLSAVTVTTASGSVTRANAFTFVSSAPVITSVSPNTGPRAGGSSIVITGQNLASVTTVEIGAGFGTITASSATSLTVTVPPEPESFAPTLPTETKYTDGTLWGLTGTYGLGIAQAWQKTQGNQNVIVAVVDTGITVHTDLGRQVPGYDMISMDDTNNDGLGDQAYVANDGDGRDSNPADPGDWVSKAENAGTAAGGYFESCGEDTSSWHGTHVAGTVNAAINGFGSVGVAPNVSVEPVRVLGKCGGFDSDISAGILWAAGGSVPNVPINANPANVISLSLGGSGPCSEPYQTAIDYAWAHNIVVTIAAGNENADATNSTPGNCNHVITVAATDSAGKRASFSNYGSKVEIAAPGVGIYSTLNSGTTSPSTQSYANYNGTSMATPHVAAVVALILSRQPTLTPDQVLTRLQSTATTFPGGRCDTATAKTCGVGIASAGAAVR